MKHLLVAAVVLIIMGLSFSACGGGEAEPTPPPAPTPTSSSLATPTAPPIPTPRPRPTATPTTTPIRIVTPTSTPTSAIIIATPTPTPFVIAAGWTRQFGSSEIDQALSVMVDGAGNVYMAGSTNGALPGYVSVGNEDSFLRKYNPTGGELWTRQFSSTRPNRAISVAVDGEGNAYVVGWSEGPLPGQPSAGDRDAFLRKYDAAGIELWTRQFGSSDFDEAWSVAVDGEGNAFVAGLSLGALPGQPRAGSEDAFLRKYDPDGTELWTRQFGSSSLDEALSVAVDENGNAYVAGFTTGTLPGQTSSGSEDTFLRKYDPDGTELWTRQFGSTRSDRAWGLAVDGEGNVYVAGFTNGTLPDQVSAGSEDAFLRKYNSAGTELWTRQFGSSQSDRALSVTVDEGGNAYVTGFTSDTLPGQVSAGSEDAFLRRYNSAGLVLWTHQFGSSEKDEAWGVAVDRQGRVYAAGWTLGALPGQTSVGDRDAFLVQVVQ